MHSLWLKQSSPACLTISASLFKVCHCASHLVYTRPSYRIDPAQAVLHMCASSPHRAGGGIFSSMNTASNIMTLSLILILILAQIELSTPSALLPRSTSVISHQFPIVFSIYVIRPIVESQLKEGGQVCLL